jgi:hypothetical protein
VRKNILKTVGVKVEYGEPVHEGEYRGTFRTIGDKEHAEMIGFYVEEGLGPEGIAKKLFSEALLELEKAVEKAPKPLQLPASRDIPDQISKCKRAISDP